jgi:CheY-like chemotaxis protein
MPRSILLVDDDDDLRTSLGHFLSDEGFPVHSARNGHDALMQLKEMMEPPGLILLDLMMPVMDGSQFLDERRRDDRLSRIPVVIMSAWTRDRKAKDGVDAVLMKPIRPEQLVKIVERYCDRVSADDSPRR